MTRRMAKWFARTGFSLIELSVVLAVTSLMLGFGLQAYQSSGAVDCTATTKQQMIVIQAAVDRYVKAHNVYPRPAARGVDITDPLFGRAVSSSGDTRIDSTAAASGDNVLYGALPFQTLGLPASYAADCWSNKFSYVVTEKLTLDATNYANNVGAITVKTGPITAAATTSNQIMTDAAYAIISHGADGVGAAKRNFATTVNTPTAHGWQGTDVAAIGTHIDTQNARVAAGIVYAAPFNNGKNAGANYFDDMIVYAKKGQMLATNLVSTMVNGACGATVGTCSAGSVTADNGQTACDTTRSWSCAGTGGGTTASCSLANAACSSCTSTACGTTAHGGTCTSYATSSVAYGSTCPAAITSTCSNGSWSITPATYPSCTVAAAASCSSPCGTIAHGATCTAYAASSVACGNTCSSQTRICSNGILSGSYMNASCVITSCATMCGSIANSCNASVPSNYVAGSCGGTATWTCTSGNASTQCSITNAACPINGSCSATAGACSAGNVTGDNGLTSCGTTRSWSCTGTNGGTTASCSKTNAACPINGICGGGAWTCNAGAAVNGSCGGDTYNWTCQGANGGSNASCSLGSISYWTATCAQGGLGDWGGQINLHGNSCTGVVTWDSAPRCCLPGGNSDTVYYPNGVAVMGCNLHICWIGDSTGYNYTVGAAWGTQCYHAENGQNYWVGQSTWYNAFGESITCSTGDICNQSAVVTADPSSGPSSAEAGADTGGGF